MSMCTDSTKQIGSQQISYRNASSGPSTDEFPAVKVTVQHWQLLGLDMPVKKLLLKAIFYWIFHPAEWNNPRDQIAADKVDGTWRERGFLGLPETKFVANYQSR